jgi:hypothetical protein
MGLWLPRDEPAVDVAFALNSHSQENGEIEACNDLSLCKNVL